MLAAKDAGLVRDAAWQHGLDLPIAPPSSWSNPANPEGGNTMRKDNPDAQPRSGGLPGTLRRSSKAAQEAFTKAHDSAVQAYGAGDQANRAAYSALKQGFEKRGDHWIPKAAEPVD